MRRALKKTQLRARASATRENLAHAFSTATKYLNQAPLEGVHTSKSNLPGQNAQSY